MCLDLFIYFTLRLVLRRNMRILQKVPMPNTVLQSVKKMSKKKKDSLLTFAKITRWRDTDMNTQSHCLLALDNVCPQITFPSIFLHSVSGTTIINFSKFLDDQGCSVCPGTQYCVVCDV